MNRSAFVAASCVCLLPAVASTPISAAAVAKLDEATIKAGLRTATPEEDGFVGRVVSLVDQGTLPAKLVDSTFQWARRKQEHRFQYFKRALIVRAAREGISL